LPRLGVSKCFYDHSIAFAETGLLKINPPAADKNARIRKIIPKSSATTQKDFMTANFLRTPAFRSR